MRLLVCGDRNWKNREYLFAILDDVRRLYGASVVIEGCARGVDRTAEEWAAERGLPVEHYPAHWDQHDIARLDRDGWCCTGDQHCKRAGILRNERMLREGRPDMVVAFHPTFQQSKGTRHMVETARKAGVTAHIFPHHTVEVETMFKFEEPEPPC